MDNLYTIIGKKIIGDNIQLMLVSMKPSEEVNTTKILKNLSGFMDSMKTDAVRSRNPDSITISKSEYAKGTYELGSDISISINE